MLYKHIYVKGVALLKKHNIESAERAARMILNHSMNVQGNDFSSTFFNLLNEHIAGKPVSKIINKKEFWDDYFFVNEHVLDPRPETETLIEAVFSHDINPNYILDLGLGTGCLLFTFLQKWPSAFGVGIDISREAINIANYNQKTMQLINRSALIIGNWAKCLATEKFDLIVSNPPYIPKKNISLLNKSVKEYDPIISLNGGEDGLNSYRLIAEDLFRILKPNGLAFFEIGIKQAHAVSEILSFSKMHYVKTYCDLMGIERVICVKKN